MVGGHDGIRRSCWAFRRLRDEAIFELLEQPENFLEWLQLLFNALVLSIGTYLQTEGQRDRVECVLSQVITIVLQVFEELIFR